MKFQTLSATALERGLECPASFQSMHVMYVATEGNEAARIGTAVHGALENFVRYTVMDSGLPRGLPELISFYDVAYIAVFGALDRQSPNYRDGLGMIERWYSRNDFTGFRVISTEQKEDFPLTMPDGTVIPVRYVMDRFDQLDDGSYRVVDYKSVHAYWSHEDIIRKMQTKVYAVAAMIRDPQAPGVWVVYDLLRHAPVGQFFDVERIREFYIEIRDLAHRLWTIDEQNIPEILGPGCRYCVRKATCETLLSNRLGGGIASLNSISEEVDLRGKVADQLVALKELLGDLDGRILEHARRFDVPEVYGNEYQANLSAKVTRRVTDSNSIAHILGPHAARYADFRVGDLDRLEKDPAITQDQIRMIRQYVNRIPGALMVKTKRNT